MNLCRWLFHPLCVFAGLIMICVGSAQAKSQSENNWRKYMQSDRDAEIAMRFPHQECFEHAADRHDLPLSLLLAVARGESDFDAKAKSKKNAYGVMQIQWPGTANDLGIDSLEELLKPCVNIDAGARYLKWLMERYNDNLHLALAAYNYGPGRIKAGNPIPEGAEWYSGDYVYSHMEYVLGRSSGTRPAPDSYEKENTECVIWFDRPYQARRFVERVRAEDSSIQIDTFRRRSDRFDVLLSYIDDKELRLGMKKIEKITEYRPVACPKRMARHRADIEKIEKTTSLEVEAPATQNLDIFSLEPIWMPFRSRPSAEGFARHVTDKADIKTVVIETEPDLFQVMIVRRDSDDHASQLLKIQKATGLDLVGKR